MTGKVNGEEQMFASADKALYEEHLIVTRSHKEGALNIAHNNVKCQELTGRHRN